MVATLIGQLAVHAPAAHATGNRSPETATATQYPPYPPYPPGNCLRHYERPTRHGWKIELVWWGGRSCPRTFFWPAKAEIWMYRGTSAPRSGPWSNDRSAEPSAIYGGHQQTDADQTSTQPAATWWEKVRTVRVSRNGSWSAEVFVDEEGPYTFAGVNSISREYVLVEVEVWDDHGGSDGTAGGSQAVPAAVTTRSDDGPGDPLLRVGVPVASSVLVLLLALGLILRARTRRLHRASAT